LDGGDPEKPSDDEGRARVQGAGRDRARRLQRVQPIGVTVGDVVEQVDGPRQRAEDREGDDGGRNGGGIDQPAPEQEAGEDEKILGPLLRA
jgi:hypothetical protein